MKEYTTEQKVRRIEHFRRVIKYRSWFGWVFTIVGAVLFGVGLQNNQMPLIMINGLMFFGYGIFMIWQTKRAREKLDRGEA